ncbi:uncharacterized protein LOC144861493 [Branchiostoma floridae x Branchiostoma japonicum]
MVAGVENEVDVKQFPGRHVSMTTVMLFTGVLLLLLQPTQGQPRQSFLAKLTDNVKKIEDTTRETPADGGRVRVGRAPPQRRPRPRPTPPYGICVKCPCVRYCREGNHHVCCKRKCYIKLC